MPPTASSSANEPPVYKVGIVLLHGTSPEIFILRPRPKTPGDHPKFVLPRGSRQYRDADGNWHDARDAATAIEHAATLEPLSQTLLREAQEEAGIDLQPLLDNGTVREMGPRLFDSRNKLHYPVHWFVGTIDDAMRAHMTPPIDATETRWATLPQIKSLIALGDFSPGYLPVIEEALKGSA